MAVLDALERDLALMPRAVRESALAAGARVAASILDGEPGARDAASLLKELRATVADLRTMAALAPEETDPIDELSRRRDTRFAEAEIPDRSGRGGRRVGS